MRILSKIEGTNLAIFLLTWVYLSAFSLQTILEIFQYFQFLVKIQFAKIFDNHFTDSWNIWYNFSSILFLLWWSHTAMIIHTFQGLFFIYCSKKKKKKRFDEKIRIHIQHTKIHTHNDVIQFFSMKNTMFEFEKIMRSVYLYSFHFK